MTSTDTLTDAQSAIKAGHQTRRALKRRLTAAAECRRVLRKMRAS